MPVIDWIRTDLEHPWADGGCFLYFYRVRFAYFDCCILERPGAETDYTPEELEQVRMLDRILSQSEKEAVVDVIIVKTQGFINGKFPAPFSLDLTFTVLTAGSALTFVCDSSPVSDYTMFRPSYTGLESVVPSGL